jgi:hypothetical protein
MGPASIIGQLAKVMITETSTNSLFGVLGRAPPPMPMEG